MLKLGLVNILNFKFSRDGDVWLRFWRKCFVQILKMKFDQNLCLNLWYDPIGYFGKMNSTLGSVVPLAMFILYIKAVDVVAHYQDISLEVSGIRLIWERQNSSFGTTVPDAAHQYSMNLQKRRTHFSPFPAHLVGFYRLSQQTFLRLSLRLGFLNC